jgi:hypothetical protein
METTHPILSMEIELIATSDEFLAICRQHDFSNIGEILQYSADELLKKPGFNMHAMMELITILKCHKLEYLLKEVY